MDQQVACCTLIPMRRIVTADIMPGRAIRVRENRTSHNRSVGLAIDRSVLQIPRGASRAPGIMRPACVWRDGAARLLYLLFSAARAMSVSLLLPLGCSRNDVQNSQADVGDSSGQHDALDRETEDRLVRIKYELNQNDCADRDWAGFYACTPTKESSEFVAYSPSAGCVWSTSESLPCARRNGAVLQFDEEFVDVNWSSDARCDVSENQSLAPRIPSSRFVKVRWGDLRFMISASRIQLFCNDFNSGVRALWQKYPCRTNESPPGEAPIGVPELPPPFRAYVLRDPLTAEISAVDGIVSVPPSPGVHRGIRSVRVTIPLGAEGGVRTGMAFHVEPLERESWYAAAVWKGQVVSTDSRSAVIEFVAPADSRWDVVPQIRAGRRVSTRGTWE